ncbi:MAG: HD domain-containing protein [Bacteroidota bacterium]
MKKNFRFTKIINDPVHGFIEIPRGILLNLIDTSAFQRLRHIKQIGLSSLVYPGAIHSRFNHALGAMHLMRQALDTLRRKSIDISEEEYEAALIAILLHDIGHGPFSHALEFVIIPDLHHEDMSLALMHHLNEKFEGELSLAIDIFTDSYPKKFLHQLVSSQLDMDRMDYLIRDSFFTGVAEGIVGIDRIIKTLNVYENQLVCESKAIYSVEKFIIARRLMYWQVYLHKAAVAAEYMVVNILKRARQLTEGGVTVPIYGPLAYFFGKEVQKEKIDREIIEKFIQLDDTDIEFAIKQWQFHDDYILSTLCKNVIRRKLLKAHLHNEPVEESRIQELKESLSKRQGFTEEETGYFVFTGEMVNQAYFQNSKEPILIWFKSGELLDIVTASDMNNLGNLSYPIKKYYLCQPSKSFFKD